MDKDLIIIAGIMGAVWLYTKRKAKAQTSAASQGTEATKAVDAESWMGAWGIK